MLAASRLTFAHGAMVAAGLLTFVAVSSVLGDRDETVSVVVAANDLAPGVAIDPADFDVVEIAADDPLLPMLTTSLPSGSLLTEPLRAGEPLLRSDTVSVGDVAGRRTITLPIAASAIEGLALSIGDRVDVIGAGADDRLTFVAHDVSVARLPSTRESSAFAAASARETWVTLAVDEAQALALSAAQREGELDLVRSTGAPPITSTASPTTEVEAEEAGGSAS